MKKNGFTLIELLAIIVILAIIAVITVPIILNIIENSKKGAAQDSAYGFKDAVEKYYVSELYNNKDLQLSGSYEVLDGKIIGKSLPSEGVLIPIDGTIPTSGFLTYEGDKLKSACLVINDYSVFFENGQIASINKGKCGPNLPGIDTTFNVDDGYNYIDPTVVGNDGNVIYYNPVTASVCNRETDSDKYISSNSVNGVKTGCMKWYAYSFKGNVVNLLLDHSINGANVSVEWCNQTDYNNHESLESELGITNKTGGTGVFMSAGNFDRGPITALKFLKDNTSSWNTKVMGDYKLYTPKTTIAQYTINYSNYKARLLTANEVANIINVEDFDETDCRTMWGKSTSLPSWMGINTFGTKGTYGYWTSTPVKNGDVYNAWYAGMSIGQHVVINEYDQQGIRPVITVSVDEIYS